jgi:opacity protein-like surface antigen
MRAITVGLCSLLFVSSVYATDETESRRPWEAYLLLGFGSAVCDNDQPDSDCPVDGGGAFGIGGDYRFLPGWAAGLEIGAWSFRVRDSWRGQLEDTATDVKFGSVAISPFARWYWWDSGDVDAYLHGGIGYGRVKAEASNDAGRYEFSANGFGYALGLGVEWWVSRLFRLGPQLLGYLHVSNEICETQDDGSEECRDPGETPDGDREGLALPWRLVVVGTFMLGER